MSPTWWVCATHTLCLWRAELAGKLTTNITQVLSKGKIIQAERMDVSSQLISNVGLTITTEMMPSFRFVAFYRIPWQRREEVVADSIWVDVANTCPGAVSDTADRLGGDGRRSSSKKEKNLNTFAVSTKITTSKKANLNICELIIIWHQDQKWPAIGFPILDLGTKDMHKLFLTLE